MESKFRIVLEYVGDRDVNEDSICEWPKSKLSRWIAFENGEVVGIGLTGQDALKAARQVGAENPILGIVVLERDWWE